MNFAGISRAALLAGILTTPIGAAIAQESADRDTVFVLGRIDNGITSSDGEVINASSIGAEEMRTFDRASVDEALDFIPGANASNTGGSRNERLIFVRGSTASRPHCRLTACVSSCRPATASTSPASSRLTLPRCRSRKAMSPSSTALAASAARSTLSPASPRALSKRSWSGR